MHTVVTLNPTLESVYLLWYVLSNTPDDVTALHFHLPQPKNSQRSAKMPLESESIDTLAISAQMRDSTRAFEYKEITIDDYIPAYGSVDSLELIYYTATKIAAGQPNGSVRVMFPDMIEDVDDGSRQLRSAHNAVLAKYPDISGFCPFIDTAAPRGRANAVDALPSNLLKFITSDPTIAIRTRIIGEPVDSPDATASAARIERINNLIALETSFRDGTHPRAGVESDGRWFVDGDKDFGHVMGPSVLLHDHPYFKHLVLAGQ